jgi:signal peptidase I
MMGRFVSKKWLERTLRIVKEKKNPEMIAILILVVLLAVSLGFLPLEPPEVRPPLGTTNRMSTFRGYEVFLDERIWFSEVTSGSMKPTFDAGDEVMWVEASIHEIGVDDIIVVTLRPVLGGEPRIVVHRVISYEPGWGAVTQGDNEPTDDGNRVTDAELHGLVIGTLFTSSEGWHSLWWYG